MARSVDNTWRVLRDFDPRDQRPVRELIFRGMRERWGERFDPTSNSDVEDISSSYVERGAEVVVAEIAGRIVGTGTLLPLDEASGRIVRVGVDRRHRRRGIARAVVVELLGRARGRSMTTVIVTTDPPWLDAISLYRSCGFEVTAETAESIQLHDGT
jgi:ribosomal protein S18 acetylase RimI-like enzyme